jgi:hypothetical protein
LSENVKKRRDGTPEVFSEEFGAPNPIGADLPIIGLADWRGQLCGKGARSPSLDAGLFFDLV